jgi:hypothetical protein
VTDETTSLPIAAADPERVTPRDHAIGAAASLVAAIAWSVLAAWRPTVTFHLAPVIVAAAWPVALRRGAALRVAASDTLRGAVGGAAIAAVATALLAVLDLLRGPTLWGSGPALVEIVPAIVVGAVGGHRYARCGATAT